MGPNQTNIKIYQCALGPLVRGILTLATLDQREASPMRQSTSQQRAPP